MPEFTIRPASVHDAAAMVDLMRELARYEKLEDGFSCDVDSLKLWLFGSPVAQALVAQVDDALVGYAVFFQSFSTFLGRPGFWLEDLYVQPSHRGAGIGKALLSALATKALQEGCARVEWAVLEWNQPAIGFYERIGATLLTDWRMCRLTGSALQQFATRRQTSAS